ncbi:MAG: hypothetical protein ACTSUE_25240 [Promethearchaeota archaeon]
MVDPIDDIDIDGTQVPTDSQTDYFDETQMPMQTLDTLAEVSIDGGSSTCGDENDNEEQISEVYGSEEDDSSAVEEEEERKKELEKQTSIGSDEKSGEETSEERELLNLSKHEKMAQVKRPQFTDHLRETNAMKSSTATAKRSRKTENGKRKKIENDTKSKVTTTTGKDAVPSSKKRKGASGSKITNRGRAALHVNQHASVNRIKKLLGYGKIRLADGVREVISDSMNFFAKKILLQAKAFVDMKSKERVTKQDISNAVASIVPYSPVSERMHANIAISEAAWLAYVINRSDQKNQDETSDKKSVRVEKACGLNVSISSLKNLSKQVIPTIRGISSNKAFIALGAAVEVIGETIIHRAVGAMISASVKKQSLENENEEEDDMDSFFSVSFKKTGPLTLTKDDINLAIHYMINTEQIQNYSAHTVYSHRKLDYETELETSLEQNAKRASNFRSKKRALKQKVKTYVTDTNAKGLLTPQEVTSYLVHDNTLPLIFRDLKLIDTSTIVDIRSEAIPERSRREYRNLINGQGVMQSDHTTLRTMGFLWKYVAVGEDAQAWYPHHRE